MAIDSQRAPRAQRARSRDGLGVLEELRAQLRTACLPVIVLTARHGETEEKADSLLRHPGPSGAQARKLLS